MRRYFVTESTAITDEGEAIPCYGVRAAIGDEVRDICFERERRCLEALIGQMNDEEIEQPAAQYIIEDFCIGCTIWHE